MANAIVTINRRARQLRNQNKNWSWQHCIEKASAEYRNEKKHAPAPAKKKKAARKVHHKKIVTTKQHNVTHRKKTNTVSHHVGVAKKILLHEIANAEARKFTMKKKSEKRKQGKKIAALKTKYRKLC